MDKTFFIISTILSTISPILPLTIYWKKRNQQEDHMKYLALILVITCLGDLIGMINSIWLGLSYVNETVSYVYYFAVSLFVSLLYKSQFPSEYRIFFVVILLLLFAFYAYWLFTDSLVIVRHDSKVPLGIAIIIFSIFYFNYLINRMPVVHIQNIQMFWITVGLMTYASGTIILFIFSEYFTYILKKDMMEYWIFHNLLNTISHVLIAIGVSKTERRKNRP